MQLPSFRDWMAQQESSAFTRRRREALLGLAPEIPDASIHSRSTFPFEKELRDKKKKKRKKKDKGKKSKKDNDITEGTKRNRPVPNRQVDDWLKEIEGLRPDLETLKSVIDKKRKEKHKKGESKSKTDVKDDNEDDPTERSERKSDDPDPKDEKSESGREPEDS